MSNESEENTESGPLANLSGETVGFSPDQMINCDGCMRANPPTRMRCLYCGTPLPAQQLAVKLQRATMSRVAETAEGFSLVTMPVVCSSSPEETVRRAASFLNMEVDELRPFIDCPQSVPLTRVASEQEALLLRDRLSSEGLTAIIVSDKDLGVNTALPRRLRTLTIENGYVTAKPGGGNESHSFELERVKLIVSGLLFVSTTEIEEKRMRAAGTEILDSREMIADESVLDIFFDGKGNSFRVSAGNFDFSCLGEEKKLLARDNFLLLGERLREAAGAATWDDSYNSVRRLLGTAWPLEQHSESGGWRRSSPGSYTTTALLTKSNAMQFTRYAYLRRFLTAGRRL
jgi:hypothetical protein